MCTFCRRVIRVDPSVVHVHYVDFLITNEVSLVTVALVSIKVNYHHFTDALEILEHELEGKGGGREGGRKGRERERGGGGGERQRERERERQRREVDGVLRGTDNGEKEN